MLRIFLLLVFLPYIVSATPSTTINLRNLSLEEAYPILEKEAAKHSDNAEVNFLLSYYYLSGTLVERNVEKGVALLQAAAEKKHPEAQYGLFDFYWRGIGGVEKNPEDAVILLTESSDAEYPPAQLKLGLLYYAGVGVEQDEQHGKHLVKAAALSGNATAQYMFAMLHFNLQDSYNEDEKESVTISENWLLKAAEQKHFPAIAILISMYLQGPDNIKSDRLAYYWALIATQLANELPETLQDKGELKRMLVSIQEMHSWIPEKIGKEKALLAKQQADEWIAAHTDKPILVH